ncbi:hypothetical protein Q3G72_020846 [Acer saccharum]|nr:hypothetical protein Q3G72_020846 [Acer saccharum]
MEVCFALVLPYDRWSRSTIEVEDVEKEEDVLVLRSHWVSRNSAAVEKQLPMKMTTEINAMARLWMTGIESSGSGGFDGERHVIVSCLIGLLHWFDWFEIMADTPLHFFKDILPSALQDKKLAIQNPSFARSVE